MSGNSSGMPSQSNTPRPNSTCKTKSEYPLSRPTCNYCKEPGHLVSECLKLKKKLERDEAKPTGLTTHRPRPQSSIKTNTFDIVTKPKSDSSMEIFEPFILNGFVSLSSDNCPPTPIKILRDTGASQSLILIKKSLDPSLSDTQTDSSMSCHSPPRSIDQGHDTLSKSQLIQEQQTDPEISKLIFKALPEDEISQVPMCYYIKNGILMRKWRPYDVPADDERAVYHQIVVPKSYRHEILSIAHESPMSGHLGINKTYHKLINHFYWPGLKSDVSKYCKTCHTLSNGR